MFKVAKSTRKQPRHTSPPPPLLQSQPLPLGLEHIQTVIEPPKSQNAMAFFDAESASAFQRPWLRLERGLRLQKLRQFSEEYPGLSSEEKDTLLKVLVKANDAKQLNTKQHIVYENEKILSIRGLKMTRIGDEAATFKIEAVLVRPTKKVKQPTS